MTPPDDSSDVRPTHMDAHGKARMVDVSEKSPTARVALARAVVELTPEILNALMDGKLPKGEGLAAARLAGIQAAKETARLIPLCHPLLLSAVEIDMEACSEDRIEITALVRCQGPTGVEMEAMTAASVAALTLYDMCKALHRGIRIVCIELVHKAGGRSGEWNRSDEDAR